MSPVATVFLTGILGLIPVARSAPMGMRVVKPTQAVPSLLRNGDFEQAERGTLGGWTRAPGGFEVAAGAGRNGSQALRCRNIAANEWTGAGQTLLLNQADVSPLMLRGWSKAEEVSGSQDGGYSLYVDIVYQDGTPWWGQTANFRTGTHDWQQRELLIMPDKPVKSMTLHCLLRGHTGTVWFDDVSLAEVRAENGATVFEGVPIALGEDRRDAGSKPATPEGSQEPVVLHTATRDGLGLRIENGAVRSLTLGLKELAISVPSGFLVRDVAADSDFFGFSRGEKCLELGLKLEAEYRGEPDHIVVEGRITDTSGKDRAVSLYFALPVDANGWRWGSDIRQSKVIAGRAEMVRAVATGCGATGTMSLYPVAAIYSENEGLALGLDMAHAAQYRLAYHPVTKQFFIAYDFGLVPDTARFPGAANFRFVLFRFEPEWGFRAAFQKYTRIFPEHFRVRSRDQGIWMPFTDVSTVQGWEDFGFKYHEGTGNVAWDDAHGVLSFRYTEPMTWWMRMDKSLPRTSVEALRLRDELVRSGRGNDARMAQISRAAAMWDDTGQPALSFRDTPWCNGAVWSLNPNPNLPGTSTSEATAEGGGRLNAATVYWNDSIKQRLYGPAAKAQQDGEYLDSLEGYVTADLNFRREHFRFTSVPLTFARDTKQAALWKGLAVFEFTKWIGEEVHRLDKLMFANGVPYRFTFLCPWLDVLGTETDWLEDGKYRPSPESQMNLWRTMAGAKPYLLLMNTDYGLFTPELVEKYFQRSLFFGMFPSMFSHNAADNPYWRNPAWYNRDRELFKKYIPLVKQVAEAGWQPVTLARCDNESILVERFGPDLKGRLYFTVLNDTATPQRGHLTLDAREFPRPARSRITELISGVVVPQGDGLEITLGPQQARLLELTVSSHR